MMSEGERADAFKSAAIACERVLRDHPDAQTFRLRVDRRHLELFAEWLQSTDPDMPPPPICKALGPLVGDVVLGRKLQRLDDITERLTAVMGGI